MTDEEKAAVFIKRYFGTYTEAFRDEMIPRLVKLIQDEREACAKIAEEKDKDGEWYMGVFADSIAEQIRARSKR